MNILCRTLFLLAIIYPLTQSSSDWTLVDMLAERIKTIGTPTVESCKTNPCKNGKCKWDPPNNITCQCNDGFQLGSDFYTCQPNDECLDTHCDYEKGEKCMRDEDSIDGSEDGIRCVCREGLVRNQTTYACDDIDECSANIFNCTSIQVCKNKYEGYDCLCKK